MNGLFVCIFNLYSTSHLASCGQGRKDGLPLGSGCLRAAGGNMGRLVLLVTSVKWNPKNLLVGKLKTRIKLN